MNSKRTNLHHLVAYVVLLVPLGPQESATEARPQPFILVKSLPMVFLPVFSGDNVSGNPIVA